MEYNIIDPGDCIFCAAHFATAFHHSRTVVPHLLQVCGHFPDQLLTDEANLHVCILPLKYMQVQVKTVYFREVSYLALTY